MGEDLFAPVLGQVANGSWKGYGSVIFLEFGDKLPLEDGERHPRGTFGLSTQQSGCFWRIEAGDDVLAGSEDSDSRIEEALRRLDGLTLNAAEILNDAGDTILRFDELIVLRTFTHEADRPCHWSLRSPEGYRDLALPGWVLDPEHYT